MATTHVPAGALTGRPIPAEITLEEAEHFPWPDGFKLEIVRGRVELTPYPGPAHARVARTIFLALHAHVSARGLGEVFMDGMGYNLPNLRQTHRAPDVSFVRAGKLGPVVGVRERPTLAPDLTVEVLSPSENWSKVNAKLEDAFAAGTAVAWVVDPEDRLITVVTPDWGRRVLREGDTLDGSPVLPEFALPVADVFAGTAP